MRAVLVGFLCAALAAGTAQADPASCPETKAVLVAVDHKWAGYEDYPIAKPDLIGHEFRVIKKTLGPAKRTEHLLLTSAGKSYVVRSEWTTRTTGTLYTSTTARAKNRPSIAPKTVSIEGFRTQTIFDGPLKGLSLQVKSCLAANPNL